jgi:Uncharacterized protein conserved in bacteria
MATDLYIVNLENGMPTVLQARQLLEQALRTARARRCPAIKIIHGYGSSGKGGAIKRDVLSLLAQKKHSGQIRCFVPGGDFSPFSASARTILDACPALAKDRDYNRGNDGITIVLL